MLISCPKCNAVYVVSESQIPESGKKFKCAECGKVWDVKPEDLRNMEPENQEIKSQIVRPAAAYDNDEADLQEMFARMSQDTKGLFTNAKEVGGYWGRMWRKIQVFFSPIMLNCTILLFIFGFTWYIAYYNRYEIVGLVPRLKDFYDKINLESIYAGKDVVFKNVYVRNIERRGKHFVEISGLLYNQGTLKSQILPIKAVMTNLNGEVEAEATKILTLKELSPEFSAVFRIVLDNKTTEAKKVSLTFDSQYYENIRRAEEAARAAEEAKRKEREKKNKSFNFGMDKGFDNF